MLTHKVNVRYSLFDGRELTIVNRAIEKSFEIARDGLPRKTGRLQSCFHYEIIGDYVFLYIDNTCFYAEYLLEKPKTKTFWNDCRTTFASTFYNTIFQ